MRALSGSTSSLAIDVARMQPTVADTARRLERMETIIGDENERRTRRLEEDRLRDAQDRTKRFLAALGFAGTVLLAVGSVAAAVITASGGG